jgi:hypothetical protein
MAGRPPKEKSFANMLNVAIKEANGEGVTKLRQVADALVKEALGGNVAAIKEIAERLDGKVPQAIVGDNDEDPINHKVELDAERFTRAIAGLVARGATDGSDREPDA